MAGDTEALPRVRPYADYLAWLAGQDAGAALAAWREYLADLDGPTRLAPPAGRDGSPSMPERWQTDLPAELTGRLQGLARQRGLTLNTVVQGLWAVLLGRLTGRDDVVFGVTVAGRPAELAGVERMVGLFINTLPLRVRLEPGEPLAALLAGIQESQSRLLAHQHVGLAEIQRAAGAGELFDTLVVFENYPVDHAALAGPGADLRVAGVEGHDATHYPLSLAVVPGERLHLRLDFDPARFDRETAEAIAGAVGAAAGRGGGVARRCRCTGWTSLSPRRAAHAAGGVQRHGAGRCRRRRCRRCSRRRRHARPTPWR